jgi:hypothetical protein
VEFAEKGYPSNLSETEKEIIDETISIMQYLSTIGRRIFKYQFAATIVSTFMLSIILIAAAYIPYLVSGAGNYWEAHIMSYIFSYGREMQLYNITFGQYVLVLAGMILALSVGTACFTFILARFSANIVMMIKAVPVGVAVAGIVALSVNMALSSNNIIFNTIFRGRFDAPEIIVCVLVAIAGVIAAVVVTTREKNSDLV